MMTATNTFSSPSFPLTNRLARIAWNTIYLIAFRHSPRPFHKWRSFLLKLFGAKVGNGVHVYPKAIIWAPWNLELGDEAGVADGVTLYCQGKITLGNRSVISQGSYICAGTHDYEVTGMPLITKPVYIGDYAWITAESFVHPGVRIGEGCVVGARSVVNKDIPPWTVCAGNPCKAIKKRIWRPADY